MTKVTGVLNIYLNAICSLRSTTDSYSKVPETKDSYSREFCIISLPWFPYLPSSSITFLLPRELIRELPIGLTFSDPFPSKAAFPDRSPSKLSVEPLRIFDDLRENFLVLVWEQVEGAYAFILPNVWNVNHIWVGDINAVGDIPISYCQSHHCPGGGGGGRITSFNNEKHGENGEKHSKADNFIRNKLNTKQKINFSYPSQARYSDA